MIPSQVTYVTCRNQGTRFGERLFHPIPVRLRLTAFPYEGKEGSHWAG